MSTFVALLTHPMTLLAFALLGGFALLEALRPARRLPSVRGWRLKGALSLLVASLISGFVPFAVGSALHDHRVLDGARLGDVGGALVGFVVFQFVFYGWHRLVHASRTLFRLFHRMHHSAERLDVWGAFFFSPLDVLAYALLSSTVSTWLLGLTVPAAIAIGIAGLALGFVQHLNVRTPRWLGYVVQRPESHSVHHGRGEHRSNYAALPLVDMLFGTFENPRGFRQRAGFWDGASQRTWALLTGAALRRSRAAAAPVARRAEPATHGAGC